MKQRRIILLLLLLQLVASTTGPAIQAQQLTSWRSANKTGKPSTATARLTDSEKNIVRKLQEFFTAPRERQAEIARQIESDQAYDSNRLSLYLHRARTFEPLKPGSLTLKIPLENGEKQEVVVRIPKAYTPERSWPLILAYHHTGGSAEEIIALVKRSLGDELDQYLVAAPAGYLPLNVESKRAWKPDHRLVLRELRKKLHLNSDRIYVTGFSQGCYAGWSYATFYGDELGGAAPVACTFDAAPEIPGLWELLMPNVSSVQILHVWGAEDRLPVYGIDLTTVTGAAAQLNNRVVDLTRSLDLNVVNYRIPNAGHSYEPPRDLLRKLFETERVQYPATVRHRFRYLVQGRAYWLEALSWSGDQWGLLGRNLQSAENEARPQTIGRMIGELLAQLDGAVHEQTIEVTQRHVGSFVVWLGPNMIDWQKPITLRVNGKQVFQGRIKPDLTICLREALRTYDFDRMRWAGIRYDENGDVRMLNSSDELPDIVFEKPRN